MALHPAPGQVSVEDMMRLQSQVDQVKERLDFISPMVPLVNFVQDYFQKVECEASMQLTRLRNAQSHKRLERDDEVSNAQLETVKWLHFVTETVMALQGGALLYAGRENATGGRSSRDPQASQSLPVGSAQGSMPGSREMLSPASAVTPLAPSPLGSREIEVGGHSIGAALAAFPGSSAGPSTAPLPQRNLRSALERETIPAAAASARVGEREPRRGPGAEGPGSFEREPPGDGGAPFSTLMGEGTPAPHRPGAASSAHGHTGRTPDSGRRASGGQLPVGGPGLAQAAGGGGGFLLTSSADLASAPARFQAGDRQVSPPLAERSPPVPDDGEPFAEPATGSDSVAGVLVLGKGSWASAYRRASGPRRDALALLCSSGIVTARELSDDLTVISEEHIDECVEIAREMLQTWPMDMWAKQPQEAKKFFEARLTALYQRKFGEKVIQH